MRLNNTCPTKSMKTVSNQYTKKLMRNIKSIWRRLKKKNMRICLRPSHKRLIKINLSNQSDQCQARKATNNKIKLCQTFEPIANR